MRPWLLSSSLLMVLAAHGLTQSNQSKDEFKLTEQEKQLLELTNAERKKENLPPFKAAALLCKAAREHSHNMAKQEKLDHELDCKSPFDRLDSVKYNYQRAAENIALSAGEPSMADILKLWMDSDGHRANILSEKYTEIGLGLAKNDKGETYATQVFAAPLKK